jgi:hypothetical protein
VKVIICESDYGKDLIVDIPEEAVKGHYCLYIGARTGQVRRVRQKNVVACGWWDLKEAGLLEENGRINKKLFQSFDMILFAHPNRVYGPVRKLYENLIDVVRSF